MDIKHTAEPWVLFEDKSRVGVDLYIKANADAVPFVAEMLTGTADYDSNFDIERSTMYANAKRIVACLNACVDIPNEELEEIAAEGGMLTPRQQIGDIAKERDTAWEELRKIREAIKANPEESTFDEVLSVLEQRDSLLHALKLARAFIANGIEVGAIRMPDSSTPDPANETLPLIDAIIAKVEAA